MMTRTSTSAFGLLLLASVDAFQSRSGGSARPPAFLRHQQQPLSVDSSSSSTVLRYANSPDQPLELRPATVAEESESESESSSRRRSSAEPVPINDDPESTALRTSLKKRLAVCSIENYDEIQENRSRTGRKESDQCGLAEDIMKELEPLRPWDGPASDPQLNARFSFVFTGVPTIGMKLITVLSRISVGFPVVDFRDVFLEVSQGNTVAKAIVSADIFGVPVELNVLTDLEVDETCEEGTMMIETFDKITIQGWTVPTPDSWSTARTLEITYLDDDMMIARTAGGEPHFLLRHSTCSTDDDLCDVDMELTAYFEEARAKYGESIARCLVDREYAKSSENDCGERSSDANPLATLLSFRPDSLFGGGNK